MKKYARLSDCGTYRWRLDRVWDRTRPLLLVIMLNPSKADALVNDPTIIRCIHLATDAGYGGIVVVNMYGYRATDPAKLAAANDPIGHENDDTIAEALTECRDVVCAWGAHPMAARRTSTMINTIRQAKKAPLVWRLTQKGAPSHPLYLPKSARPIEWWRAAL